MILAEALLKSIFKKILLDWYDPAARPMPWKDEKNPYKIWISEVILQQTRVEQGWEYYKRFIDKFPDVFSLANAPIEAVLKLWQGLGYYSRARNLHKGAQQLVADHNGEMPRSFNDILALSSVGPYTAAAIASFAYNMPHAVVDGNVIRIISRVFGIDTPFDTSVGQKLFKQLADELLDQQQAGRYNQAIMDFGATVCTPSNPKCDECPFSQDCVAFLSGKTSELPVKSKKIKKRERHFNYFVFQHQDEFLVFQRDTKDVYSGMYEFYLWERETIIRDDIVKLKIEDMLNESVSFTKFSLNKPHILTHQRLFIHFFQFNLNHKLSLKGGSWRTLGNLKKLPVPKFIHDYMERL